TGTQRAFPERRQPVAARDCIALYCGDGAVVEARARVELRVEAAVECLRGELLFRSEGVGEAPAAVAVRVAVAIGVVAEVGGIGDRVEPRALLIASLKRNAPRPGATARACRVLAGVVRAVTGARVRRESAARISREHLNHATDGVG